MSVVSEEEGDGNNSNISSQKRKVVWDDRNKNHHKDNGGCLDCDLLGFLEVHSEVLAGYMHEFNHFRYYPFSESTKRMVGSFINFRGDSWAILEFLF